MERTQSRGRRRADGVDRSQRASGAVLWGRRRGRGKRLARSREAERTTERRRADPEDGVEPKLGGPGRRRRALGQGQRRRLGRSSDVEYRGGGGSSRLPDTRGKEILARRPAPREGARSARRLPPSQSLVNRIDAVPCCP